MEMSDSWHNDGLPCAFEGLAMDMENVIGTIHIRGKSGNTGRDQDDRQHGPSISLPTRREGGVQ